MRGGGKKTRFQSIIKNDHYIHLRLKIKINQHLSYLIMLHTENLTGIIANKKANNIVNKRIQTRTCDRVKETLTGKGYRSSNRKWHN